MPNGNLLPRLGRSFEKLADLVIECNLAFLNKHQYSGGKKLLADRTYFVDGLGPGGNVEINIRQSVALPLYDLPKLYYSNGNAGDVLLPHLGFDVVVYLVGAHGDGGGQ